MDSILIKDTTREERNGLLRNPSGASTAPVTAALPDSLKCTGITLTGRKRSGTSTWNSVQIINPG